MTIHTPTTKIERKEWKKWGDTIDGAWIVKTKDKLGQLVSFATRSPILRLIADVERLEQQVEAGRECAASLEETNRLLKSGEIGGVFHSAYIHGVKISEALAEQLGDAGECREEAIMTAREFGLLKECE